MTKNISIIIVHWNTPDLLEKQLDRLYKSFEGEIFVVDNNSKELITFQNKFPRVTFINNQINRGYAFACNQGAVIAKCPAPRSSKSEVGDWLLFLNPDVEIDSSQIEQLLNYVEINNLVACSPEPQSDNYKKPVPTTWSLLTEFTPLRHVIPAPCPVPNVVLGKAGIYSNRSPIRSGMTLTGGCLLIKTEIFKKLGGFDERFFLWFEDSDLTKRLIDNKYRFGFAPVTIEHSGGESFKKNDWLQNRDIFFNSMNIYAKKHFSQFGQILISVLVKRYSPRRLLPKINNGVSITIPNVELGLLKDFLEINSRFFSDTDEYIVVTSGIAKREVWVWREKYPNIRFIPIKKNNGFATTVNIGFRVSTGEYVGTINDDVVNDSNWIQDCLECADEKTGSINPIIKKNDESVESAGIIIMTKGKAIPKTTYDTEKKCYETDATNAAAVLYSKEVLNKIGLFDEKFGSYLEDIDLSFRINKAGYKNIVCTTSSVIHHGQQTSEHFLGNSKKILDAKNWWLVILKNWGIKKLIINAPAILLERLRNISGVLKST